MVDRQFVRAQVTIPNDSALPRDSVVNTWSFRVPGSLDGDLYAADVKSRLAGFYSAWGASISSAYNPGGATIKLFDFGESQPRIPFYESALTITGATTTSNDMPNEVALCLSFEGDRLSGFNQRRRRGRVFLGPFQIAAGDYEHITNSFVDALMTAANTWLLDPGGTYLADWAVYSPYTHHDVPVGEKLNPDTMPEVPLLLNASFVQVTKTWMDNSWDTVRRRGVEATYRKVYNA